MHYLIEINRNGLKSLSTTRILSKMYRKIEKELKTLEPTITKKELQTPENLGRKLKKIHLNQSIIRQFNNTKVIITKIETI